MATNTVNVAHSNGNVIDASHVNELGQAIGTAFVGRNSSGVPAAGQSLGTIAFPWGTTYSTSLILNGSSVDPTQITAPVNRLVSGKTRATSNQPAFITPNGGAASAIVEGLATSLAYDVNGTIATLSADLTISSLSTAPSSNNTCLVNDSVAADQETTRTWGEINAQKEYITVNTMGSEIVTLVGTFQAFKLYDGANDEYFIAYVESTTKLSKIHRGFFYDSGLLPVNRLKFTNTDTITLLKLGYVFLEDNATTTEVSYTQPSISFVAPTAPAAGDYWYKLPDNEWKRYNGSSWITINRTYIGMVIMDNVNCIGARCIDFYANYKALNTFELEKFTSEIIKTKKQYSAINVAGNDYVFNTDVQSWNITVDLAASVDMYNATEQASRNYFYYVKDTGALVISDIDPYLKDEFNQLYYHPHNPWRCVGQAFNDSGSDILGVSSYLDDVEKARLWIHTHSGYGSSNVKIPYYTTVQEFTGGDFSYTNGSTDGLVVTIQRAGVYVIEATQGSAISGDLSLGISLNSDGTQSINSRPNSQRLSYAYNGPITSADPSTALTTTKRLVPGDEIKPHTNNAPTPNTAAKSIFIIQRVSN